MAIMSPLSSRLLHNLPIYGALLPLLTFNLSYVIAAALEHVPACIPYIEGCTSVSSTGRAAPESILFKAGMLGSAIVFAVLWWRTARFLRTAGRSSLAANALRGCALLAVMSLLVYAVTLGMQDAPFRSLRRVGINGFALGNLLSCTVFIVLYRPYRIPETRLAYLWLVTLCVAIPLLGLVAELAKANGLPRRAVNNVAAWNASLLVAGYYLAFGTVWRRHQLAPGAHVREE